jgi:hypothetical protein
VVLVLMIVLGALFLSQQSGAAASGDITASPDEVVALRQTNAALVAQVASATVSPTAVPASATLAPTSTLMPSATDTPTEHPSLTFTATMTDVPDTPTVTPTSTTNRTMTALVRTLTRIAVFNQQATETAEGAVELNVPLITPTVTLNTAQVFVTVNGTSGANLRGGPGQNYAVVETAARGQRYDVIARYGDGPNRWYLVQRETGRAAWVWSGVVELQPADAVVGIALTIPPIPGGGATSAPTNPPQATSGSGSQNPAQPPAGGGQPAPTAIPPTPIPPTPVPPTPVPPTPIPPSNTPIPPPSNTPIPPTPYPTDPPEPPCNPICP